MYENLLIVLLIGGAYRDRIPEYTILNISCVVYGCVEITDLIATPYLVLCVMFVVEYILLEAFL